jgi:LPXTG-motif cell wall-anchored protein
MSIVGVAACAASVVLLFGSVAQAADPIPAGETTIQIAGTFSFLVDGTPTPIDFTGQLVGTSDGAGKLTFPKSGITFPDVAVTLVGQSSVVHVSATGNWTATVDTDTGVMTTKGGITTLIDIGDAIKNCGLGPLNLNLSTQTSGGKPYTEVGDHATATVVDRTFAVPTATDPSGTCALAPAIDGVLGLPIAAGSEEPARFILANQTIFPPGAEVPTTTTVPITTPPATQGTAAPATVAPAATDTGALPRTGASSAPLAALGAVCVVTGIALVGGRRRRRA